MDSKFMLLNRESDIKDESIFNALNLDMVGLENVKKAWESGNILQAKSELVNYFHSRTNVKFLFDYRGTPLRPIHPDDSPYSFQCSMGYEGSLLELCLKIADKLMHNIYLRPSGKRGEFYLGENLENMPKFNFISDQAKLHRSLHDQFTRGQFFEALAVLYHQSGDESVSNKFKEVLEKFFETYSLEIEYDQPDASHWMMTDDRDVMSVGWLTFEFITLLYTELPYTLPSELTFKMIAHMWFFATQFRRFDNDEYRPFNHHLWERGLMPFMLSVLLPEFPDISVMKEKGKRIISQHVFDDFNDHGGYNEHSIAYWSGAVIAEMLYRGAAIAYLNGEEFLTEKSMGHLSKTLDALALIAPPTERYPSVGDNLGTAISPILFTAQCMMKNNCCTSVLNARLQKESPKSLPLDYCDNLTGFAVGRSDWTNHANYFMLSMKENCGFTGHNHMDMLSLTIIARGKSFIAEPYAGALYHNIKMGSDHRGFMYNMTSHNTVLVHGEPIVPNEMYADLWAVYRPDVKVDEFLSNEKGMVVKAHHDGYTFCRHSRTVVLSRKNGFVVKDEIAHGQRVKRKHIQRWFLDVGVQCEVLSEGMLLLKKDNVKLLFIWELVPGLNMKLWKKDDLYPEIISDKKLINYIIDIEFEQTSINLAMIDVTDRDFRNFKGIRDIFNTDQILDKLDNL